MRLQKKARKHNLPRWLVNAASRCVQKPYIVRLLTLVGSELSRFAVGLASWQIDAWPKAPGDKLNLSMLIQLWVAFDYSQCIQPVWWLDNCQKLARVGMCSMEEHKNRLFILNNKKGYWYEIQKQKSHLCTCRHIRSCSVLNRNSSMRSTFMVALLVAVLLSGELTGDRYAPCKARRCFKTGAAKGTSPSHTGKSHCNMALHLFVVI